MVLPADRDAQSGGDPDFDRVEGETDVETTESDAFEFDPLAPMPGKPVITENPLNGLSATVDCTLDRPAYAWLSVKSADGTAWETEPGEAAESQQLNLLGLTAEQDYVIRVMAADDDGRIGRSEPVDYRTRALPDDFPPLRLAVHAPERVQPGVSLFRVSRQNPELDVAYGLILGVDASGDIVWYHRDNSAIYDVEPLSDGGLIYISMTDLCVIDLMGRELKRYQPLDIGTEIPHHEVAELPDGNLAVLSTEMRQIGGYPIEGGQTTAYNVMGDQVVEFTREGDFVRRFSLFDVLDPHRVREGFHSDTWSHTKSDNGLKDWTHANGLVLDTRDDSWVLSLRHQDWIVKIDRTTGELVWRLGEEGDFTLEGEGQWFYHQHAPQLLDNGNILIYDNGNTRPDTDPYYTRVVEYELDEESRIARQVWEYRGVEDYYAHYVGDADRLENGNTLISDGGLLVRPDLLADDPANRNYIRLTELGPGPDYEVVWKLFVDDDRDGGTGYSGYSVRRIEGW